MKYKACLFFLFSSLIIQEIISQEPNENRLIILESPSKHFSDIVLLGHKGLPRLGVFDDHAPETVPRTKGNGRVLKAPPTADMLEKNRLLIKGYETFCNFIKIPSNVDSAKSASGGKPATAGKEENRDSQYTGNLTQQNLQNILNALCVSEECKNAFTGNNEFERRRNSQTFKERVLPDLLQWRASLLKDDRQVAYHVIDLLGARYDFERKGYGSYVHLDLYSYPGRPAPNRIHFDLVPKNDYEASLKKAAGLRSEIPVFIPLSPEKAEEMQKRDQHLYAVRKIEFDLSSRSTGKHRGPKFNYYHISPQMEIYEDKALTKKLFTISLDELVLGN